LKVGSDGARPVSDLASEANDLDVLRLEALECCFPLFFRLVADISAVEKAKLNRGPSGFL
jgi:hypothetical protein